MLCLKFKKLGDLTDTIFVCDLVSNITYRTEQLDGQQLLATKSGGRYHLDGRVTTVAKNLLANILFNLRTLLNTMDCEKVFLPPLPRYLFTPCCNEEGHCDGVGEDGYALELLQKSNVVRKQIKDNLTTHHTKIVVPTLYDTMFPDATTPGKILEKLRKISSNDGVHLTPDGYRLWSEAILKVVNEKMLGDASTHPKAKQYFWRGFISPVGSERPSNMGSYHQNRQGGGGKWPRGGSGRGGPKGPRGYAPRGARGSGSGGGGHARPPYHRQNY